MKFTQQTATPVTDWRTFAERVRSSKLPLLACLDEFSDSVLVTGCQRSGTTILSRIITESEGIDEFGDGHDVELASALILSGQISYQRLEGNRNCFQTTYLNERYREYFDISECHKIIWVLRNPYSVVYSMRYNWNYFSMSELFVACGIDELAGLDYWRYKLLRRRGLSSLKRACYAYSGKLAQLFELQKKLDRDRLLVVDYDDMVRHKATYLPKLYEFLRLPYQVTYANKLHDHSLSKAKHLSAIDCRTIERICMPVYSRAQKLLGIEN